MYIHIVFQDEWKRTRLQPTSSLIAMPWIWQKVENIASKVHLQYGFDFCIRKEKVTTRQHLNQTRSFHYQQWATRHFIIKVTTKPNFRACQIYFQNHTSHLKTSNLSKKKDKHFLAYIMYMYKRRRQWPVTDIGDWPIVNASSRNKKKPDSF